MIKKKLGLKIDDLKNLKENLSEKIDNAELFVCRGKDYLDEELFSIVGSVKSYTILEDGTAEFTVRPLMKGYEGPIEDADSLELSIDESDGINVKRLILMKDGKYI